MKDREPISGSIPGSEPSNADEARILIELELLGAPLHRLDQLHPRHRRRLPSILQTVVDPEANSLGSHKPNTDPKSP